MSLLASLPSKSMISRTLLGALLLTTSLTCDCYGSSSTGTNADMIYASLSTPQDSDSSLQHEGRRSSKARHSLPSTEGLGSSFNEFYNLTIQKGHSIEKFYGGTVFEIQKHLSGYAHGSITFRKKCRHLGVPEELLDQNIELIEKMRQEMLAARNAPQAPHLTPTEPKAQASLISVSRKSSADSSSSIDSDEQPGLEDHIEGVSKSTLIRRKPIQNGSAASTDSDGSDGDGPSALPAFRKQSHDVFLRISSYSSRLGI